MDEVRQGRPGSLAQAAPLHRPQRLTRPISAAPVGAAHPLTVYWSDQFLDHLVSPGHPESPARLNSIVERLKRDGVWAKVHIVDPVAASLQSLKAVHPEDYITRLQREIDSGAPFIDAPDTEVSTGSWQAALKMAGAGMQAVDQVLSGQSRTAFVLGRPPGHHALSDAAMGFCLLANISLAARHAQINHHVERIMVIDWDVHHGNGTQNIFYASENLYFVSLHEHPLYPGTGSEDETGTAQGRGFTRNFPLSAGGGDETYLRIMTTEIADLMHTYQPELLLISAGFDAHARDPLASLRLEEEDFAWITGKLVDIAGEHCDGRIVSTLEGGYDLEALGNSVTAHVGELMRA